MFCRSLFVLSTFFFWSLCCLFFVDLRILITSLVSSNSSYTQTTMDSAKIKYEMAILKSKLRTTIDEKLESSRRHSSGMGGTNIDSYKSPLGYISKLTVLSILLYWNKQHTHNQVVREIMGSCPDRVKSYYRICTWWFSAKSHSIKEKGQRLFVSESG